jgi:hypothetical protein
VAAFHRMVRITIEQMTEPKDVMLGQLEVPSFLVVGDLTGKVEAYFAIAFGAHIQLPINERELEAYFKAQRAEAM